MQGLEKYCERLHLCQCGCGFSTKRGTVESPNTGHWGQLNAPDNMVSNTVAKCICCKRHRHKKKLICREWTAWLLLLAMMALPAAVTGQLALQPSDSTPGNVPHFVGFASFTQLLLLCTLML